jgi:hypothetical protein
LLGNPLLTTEIDRVLAHIANSSPSCARLPFHKGNQAMSTLTPPHEATKLRDVIVAVRADEAGHRDRNHQLANALYDGSQNSLAFARPMAAPASLHAVPTPWSDVGAEGRRAA